jgi:protein NEDD1
MNSAQNVQQAEQIREVVREEVENLQDEMEEKLRNLHIDMINQFHQQSQEIETVLSKHFSALERLTVENQQLREENERLRRGPMG